MGKWILVVTAALAMTSLRAQDGVKARAFCDPADAKNRCPGTSCVCSEDVLSVTFADLETSVLEVERFLPGLPVEAAVVLDVKSFPVQGWAYGVRHDAEIITLVSVTFEGTDAARLFRNGFQVTTMEKVFECGPEPGCTSSREGGGFIQACVLSLTQSAQLEPRKNSLARATYRLEESPDEAEVLLLQFTDRLRGQGSPPVAINFTVNGRSRQPRILVDGWIRESSLGRDFHRGDANGDGKVNIGDSISLLLFLFVFGPAPGCLEAADFDDDGRLDTTDPILILRWLFLQGSAPAFPGGPPASCGPDPGGAGRELGCSDYAGC